HARRAPPAVESISHSDILKINVNTFLRINEKQAFLKRGFDRVFSFLRRVASVCFAAGSVFLANGCLVLLDLRSAMLTLVGLRPPSNPSLTVTF
ncbi:MAG: hypothetical protein J6W00_09370, partial [Lentisphaeria bacterium]|nr:hypothetical protein [Lentisphaeria bacterium]